jgi:hypothetical protein
MVARSDMPNGHDLLGPLSKEPSSHRVVRRQNTQNSPFDKGNFQDESRFSPRGDEETRNGSDGGYDEGNNDLQDECLREDAIVAATGDSRDISPPRPIQTPKDSRLALTVGRPVRKDGSRHGHERGARSSSGIACR